MVEARDQDQAESGAEGNGRNRNPAERFRCARSPRPFRLFRLAGRAQGQSRRNSCTEHTHRSLDTLVWDPIEFHVKLSDYITRRQQDTLLSTPTIREGREAARGAIRSASAPTQQGRTGQPNHLPQPASHRWGNLHFTCWSSGAVNDPGRPTCGGCGAWSGATRIGVCRVWASQAGARGSGSRVSDTGGEGGIRTHGGPEGHNGFRDRPIQPLWHLSAGDYTATGPRFESLEAPRATTPGRVRERQAHAPHD